MFNFVVVYVQTRGEQTFTATKQTDIDAVLIFQCRLVDFSLDIRSTVAAHSSHPQAVYPSVSNQSHQKAASDPASPLKDMLAVDMGERKALV